MIINVCSNSIPLLNYSEPWFCLEPKVPQGEQKILAQAAARTLECKQDCVRFWRQEGIPFRQTLRECKTLQKAESPILSFYMKQWPRPQKF